MAEATFEEIGEVIERYDRFLIISHANPDGDAIGSTLALGSVLKRKGKQVYLRNEDGVPQGLSFMEGGEMVKKSKAEILEVDVVIALDCANKERLGETTIGSASGAKVWMNIDHHKTNTRYGDLCYVDTQSPATGQIVYQLCQHLDYQLTDIARDAIYVAVSTDTGSFRYPGTTSTTYQMAADLVDRGLNVGEVNQQIYERSPLRRVKLLGEYLTRLSLTCEGKIADWWLPMEVKKDLELLPDDSEDMINHIRAIDGVVVACSFEAIDGGKVRISLRSKSDLVDVSVIAGVFGGGGHFRAAGIRYEGTIQEARQAVLEEVSKTVNKAGV